MSGKTRVDNSELENRIFEVTKMILSGYSKRAFLIQHISKTTNWNVCDRQVDNYIKGAKELIKESFSKEDLDLEKSMALNRLEGLYTMNLKIQDYNQCRALIMDRAKLLGILSDKLTLEGGDKPITISFED